jgi:sulfite exporter TauE/SafE
MFLVTAFILGLVGSPHCAGMCGPLALAITAASPRRFLLGRLAYNSGRILTYCAMGLVFGLLGKSFLVVGIQRWASIGLGIALLLGLFVSRKLALWRPVTALVERLKSSMSVLLRQRSLASLVLLGLLNGLLPCGLVYVACAGAVAAGGIISGVAYMAAFGAGTVPMLLGISLSGQLVPLTLRLRLRKAVPVSIFLLAAILVLRGMSLGIPYLSPDLSGGSSSCCHR